MAVAKKVVKGSKMTKSKISGDTEKIYGVINSYDCPLRTKADAMKEARQWVGDMYNDNHDQIFIVQAVARVTAKKEKILDHLPEVIV